MHCGYRILVKGSYEATKAVAKKAQKKKIHFQVRQYSDEILGEPNYSVQYILMVRIIKQEISW